jgi:hypothetical protein
MAALFLYAVYVQHNDVDPIRWMLVYAAAAAFSLMAAFRRIPFVVLLALSLVSLIWAATIAPSVIGKQSLVDSEEGREMLGLALVAVWTAVLMVQVRFQSRGRSDSKPV